MALLQVSRNLAAANAAFEEKKEIYRQSPYLVTSQIADYGTWGMEEINARQADLAEIAVRTWSLAFDD